MRPDFSVKEPNLSAPVDKEEEMKFWRWVSMTEDEDKVESAVIWETSDSVMASDIAEMIVLAMLVFLVLILSWEVGLRENEEQLRRRRQTGTHRRVAVLSSPFEFRPRVSGTRRCYLLLYSPPPPAFTHGTTTTTSRSWIHG